MKRLTPVEWSRIAEELSWPGGRVDMRVDGYRVTWMVSRKRTLKPEIHGCINGEVKGTWHVEDCPERRILFRPYWNALVEPARRPPAKDARRELADRYGINKQNMDYSPCFASPADLQRHLRMLVADIELLKVGNTEACTEKSLLAELFD